MRIKAALDMDPPQIAIVIYIETRQPKKCGIDSVIPLLQPRTVPGT